MAPISKKDKLSASMKKQKANATDIGQNTEAGSPQQQPKGRDATTRPGNPSTAKASDRTAEQSKDANLVSRLGNYWNSFNVPEDLENADLATRTRSLRRAKKGQPAPTATITTAATIGAPPSAPQQPVRPAKAENPSSKAKKPSKRPREEDAARANEDPPDFPGPASKKQKKEKEVEQEPPSSTTAAGTSKARATAPRPTRGALKRRQEEEEEEDEPGAGAAAPAKKKQKQAAGENPAGGLPTPKTAKKLPAPLLPPPASLAPPAPAIHITSPTPPPPSPQPPSGGAPSPSRSSSSSSSAASSAPAPAAASNGSSTDEGEGEEEQPDCPEIDISAVLAGIRTAGGEHLRPFPVADGVDRGERVDERWAEEQVAYLVSLGNDGGATAGGE